MSSKYLLYYVEGKDEKKLVNVLKSEMMKIAPGKVDVLNVIQQKISDARIMTFQPNTIVILVYDTDINNVEILESNISKLQKCSCVSAIYTIPQVKNLEDELVRSCDIKNIKQLLGSRSTKDYKKELIKVSNLSNKLYEHDFSIDKFWACTPNEPFEKYGNDARKIKLHNK